MKELLISIIGSIIAAVFVALVSLLSKNIRRALTAVISEFLGIEVKYVFRNGKAAEETIRQALKESSDIRIFAGRGNDFQGTLYTPILDPTLRASKNVKILLPDIYSSPRKTDWIAHRENELALVDGAFGNGHLRIQIGTSIAHLRSFLSDRFRLQVFDAPHVGRLIITDRFVFFTPYANGKHGRDCRLFQYGRGDTYDFFVRFFEMMWTDSDALPRTNASSFAGVDATNHVGS